MCYEHGVNVYKRRDCTTVVSRAWGLKMLEQLTDTALHGVMMLIFARWLGPSQIAVFTMANMMISFAHVITSAGISTALLREEHVSDDEYLACLTLNMLTGLALGILYIVAANNILLKERGGIWSKALVGCVAILACTLPLDGIYQVLHVRMVHAQRIGSLYISTLAGRVMASCVCILIHRLSTNVFISELIYLPCVYILVDISLKSIILSVFNCHRSRKLHSDSLFHFNSLRFVRHRIQKFYRYSWKLTAAALLETSSNQLRAWMIGGHYSTNELSCYTQGMLYPQTFMGVMGNTIDTMAVPFLIREKENVKRMLYKSSILLCMMMAISAIGMSTIFYLGRWMVIAVLGNQWQHAIPYLRIGCIAYSLVPIQSIFLSVIKVYGRSDIFLMVEVAKKCISIVFVINAIGRDPMLIAHTVLWMSAIGIAINGTAAFVSVVGGKRNGQ